MIKVTIDGTAPGISTARIHGETPAEKKATGQYCLGGSNQITTQGIQERVEERAEKVVRALRKAGYSVLAAGNGFARYWEVE